MITIPDFATHALLAGGHRQTLCATFLTGAKPLAGTEMHVVQLADGDRIVLHDNVPSNWQPTDPVVLLLHGLCGSHRSGYMLRVASKLLSRGFRTFRMDHRCAGAAFLQARRGYHAGISDDVASAWEAVGRLCPQSRGAIVGFSLSGNIVLRALAVVDWHGRTPVCAVAVNPPIDLNMCARALHRWNNWLYERHFVSQLLKQLHLRMQAMPDLPKPSWNRPPRTLRDFDHGYTAHVWGFESAEDYYTRASSRYLIPQITIPTLILTARDDTLVPVSMFDPVGSTSAVNLHIAPGGGHLGYIGRRTADGDRRWLDWRILEWLTAFLR